MMQGIFHNPTPGSAQGRNFATTHWSVVLAAGDCQSPRAEAALEELCRAYWYPLYVYARQRGHSPEEAEDLTQEFFAQLVRKQLLCGIKREGARFRSYLLVIFKCFLANVWHRDHAQKRSGSHVMLSMDEEAEIRYARELTVDAPPETAFDRQWAWTVLDRVYGRLRDEYSAAGKAEIFEQLQGYLPCGENMPSYEHTAAALQMNQPAVRMAVHRLKRRFGELLRIEVGDTVSTPAEIDGEIRFLLGAASR